MTDGPWGRSSRGRGAVALILVLALAACGSQQPSIANPSSTEAETIDTTAAPDTSIAPTTTEPEPTTSTALTTGEVVATDELEAVTGVLESPEHGPELCLLGMLDSLPPQCGGLALTNWDWSRVDGAETLNGTTWIDQVLVVGHRDGDAFVVSTVRAPTDDDLARLQPPPLTIPRAPCPEPPGGWLAQAANAPASAMLDLNGAVGAYVAAQPDGAAFWLDQSINTSNDPMQQNDPQRLVVVATFTGDLDRHETELRAIWPGALCVGPASISARDLAAIAKEINAGIVDGTLTLPNGAQLDMLSFNDSGNTVLGAVEYDVVFADPAAQQYFDETYGPGRVVLHGALRPTGR